MRAEAIWSILGWLSKRSGTFLFSYTMAAAINEWGPASEWVRLWVAAVVMVGCRHRMRARPWCGHIASLQRACEHTPDWVIAPT